MGGRGMTRQELLVAGAAAYGALFLPGCGSSGDSDELTFWNGFTGGDAPTLLAIIDAFLDRLPRVGPRPVGAADVHRPAGLGRGWPGGVRPVGGTAAGAVTPVRGGEPPSSRGTRMVGPAQCSVAWWHGR